MKIVLTSSGAESAELVAGEILRRVRDKPDLVLGLATGSTPIGVYQLLREAHGRGDVDFSQVRTFNLDEYLDLSADHPRSYRRFMREHLFDGVNVPAERIHFPPAEGDDLDQRCRAYEDQIRAAGGIDIQLLGIGRNGHIGFNEPTSSLRSRTGVRTLTQRTVEDNARFFEPGEPQPTMAATMGIGTILDARQILLQATGDVKAEAIRATVEGPVSSFFPASALQLHEEVTAFIDPDASRLLTMRRYYELSRMQEKSLRDAGRL